MISRSATFRKTLSSLCIVALFVCSAWAQKVKIGYDKAVDFTQYKTYVWADLEHPPSRPVLYQLIVATVDHELEEKGLKKVESEADLLLFPAGGVDSTFAMSAGAPVGNFIDVPLSVATGSWVGPYTITSAGVSPIVNAGTLMIAFVDRKRGLLVWEGRVSDEFDADRRKESAERAQKCVTKLLKDFPPRATK
jgi:hypothetical protein